MLSLSDIASEIHKASMFIILDVQSTSFTHYVGTLMFCVFTKLHLPNQKQINYGHQNELHRHISVGCHIAIAYFGQGCLNFVFWQQD